MNIAYIALGSNLGNPALHVKQAVIDLAQLKNSNVEKYSSLYRSMPLYGLSQPTYINAVVKLSTMLTPYELLHELFLIEKQHGRIRDNYKNSSRTLDLDLLMYNTLRLHETELILPHAGLLERAFVLIPLHEIEPHLILPNNISIADWIEKISTEGLQRYEP